MKVRELARLSMPTLAGFIAMFLLGLATGESEPIAFTFNYFFPKEQSVGIVYVSTGPVGIPQQQQPGDPLIMAKRDLVLMQHSRDGRERLHLLETGAQRMHPAPLIFAGSTRGTSFVSQPTPGDATGPGYTILAEIDAPPLALTAVSVPRALDFASTLAIVSGTDEWRLAEGHPQLRALTENELRSMRTLYGSAAILGVLVALIAPRFSAFSEVEEEQSGRTQAAAAQTTQEDGESS